MDRHIGVVFIHGAGLGSFIWDQIKPLIQYPVLAIDLPNREESGDKNKGLAFDDYVQSTIDQIEVWDQDKIVLVAHSIGGCLGLQLADQLSERVVGFVGLSASIPKSGKSFVSCLPFPQKFLLPLILTILGTKPPQKSIESSLGNDLTTEQRL